MKTRMRMHVRNAGRLLLLVWLAAAPIGCDPFAKKAAKPTFVLSGELDDEEAIYQPGEAVVVTATVKNQGKVPVELGALCAETAEFWFGPVSTDLRYRREVVKSPKESGFPQVTVAPGEAISRRFVLTRVTEEEGQYALVFFYNSCGVTPGTPGTAAPAMVYVVDGKRRFRRDETGLIRKEDAIAVVKRGVGSELLNTEAKLVRNEAGFLDWWVRGEVKVNDSLAKRAFFVNPYTGAIRAEAGPEDAPGAKVKEKTKSSQ